ncbi:UNVERIFIED_CONTAM: hypothetical protein K2H54_041003 [Gekko kuhli]
MPAKGKYFFNESEGGGKITDPLYEKYRYSSQQHPLLLFLLGIALAYCVTLIVVLCAQDDPREHLTFTVTVCLASVIFIIIYVLVCIESLFWCRLKLFAAVIWVCLLVLGYVSVFDKGEDSQVAAWEQVPFFLFIIFTAYTMLPFGMREAIVVSSISALSHIVVLTIVANSEKQEQPLVFQVSRKSSEKRTLLTGIRAYGLPGVGTFSGPSAEKSLKELSRCL